MLIALAQVNLHIGNFAYNLSQHLKAIEKAKNAGASLVVFPELSVCGYPPQDLLEFDDFIEKCSLSVTQIAAACNGISAVVGAPVKNNEKNGKRLFNAALLLSNGRIEQTVYKQLLPNYDVFDESRYFEAGGTSQCISVDGQKIALTICEDLWDMEIEAGSVAETGRSLYASSPMASLSIESPLFALNISSSPFSRLQGEARRVMLKRNARQYKIPFLYVNQTGMHTDLIFDGESMATDAHGEVKIRAALFAEDLVFVDTEKLTEMKSPEINGKQDALVHDALVFGIRDYFTKMGFRKALVGLSGGIDSALVVALACKALGAENVLAILLPSSYSSAHSVNDSMELIKNLGCVHELISIQQAVDVLGTSLLPFFAGTEPGIAEENIQARTRGLLLMAIANKQGHILLNTTNKSEAAVGYGTLYGDMNGSLAVLGDVYKTQVYALANYINREKEVIPVHIINKEPSAELRPGQKDSDSLPPYHLLDAILENYIEKRKTSSQLLAEGFEKNITEKVIKMVNASEYKRFQMPPVLRVTPKAFGIGRRIPLVAFFN